MTTREWLSKERYPNVMTMTFDNLAIIIDRFNSESIPTQSGESMQDAVAFAEWIENNNWFQDGDFRWFHDVNQINRKSTTELYQLFKHKPTTP